jgi:hypothetical protein
MQPLRWQIPLKRLLWATFLMAVCAAVWARSDFANLPGAIVLVAGLLTMIVFLIAVRAPGLRSYKALVAGLATVLAFWFWMATWVP